MLIGGEAGSGQEDVVELLDPGSTDRTLAAALTGRTDLSDAISAKADMSARLKNDLAGIRKADGAAVAGSFVGLGAAKLISQTDVLLVGLLRRLVEEERRQGGDHETEELENSPEDVSDVPGLSGRSGGRGRGRSIARNSAHLGQVLLLVSSEGC